MPRRALALLLCLSSLALVAAGCGGDTDTSNDYVRAVETARQSFSTRFGQIQGQFTTTSTAAEDRRSLAQFASATTDVIKKLQAIDVPGKVQDQHGELIRAYQRYLSAITTARRTAKSDKPADLQQARTDLSSAIGPVQEAIMTAVADINDELRS